MQTYLKSKNYESVLTIFYKSCPNIKAEIVIFYEFYKNVLANQQNISHGYEIFNIDIYKYLLYNTNKCGFMGFLYKMTSIYKIGTKVEGILCLK